VEERLARSLGAFRAWSLSCLRAASGLGAFRAVLEPFVLAVWSMSPSGPCCCLGAFRACVLLSLRVSQCPRSPSGPCSMAAALSAPGAPANNYAVRVLVIGAKNLPGTAAAFQLKIAVIEAEPGRLACDKWTTKAAGYQLAN
jgi:hypothetical protein